MKYRINVIEMKIKKVLNICKLIYNIRKIKYEIDSISCGRCDFFRLNCYEDGGHLCKGYEVYKEYEDTGHIGSGIRKILVGELFGKNKPDWCPIIDDKKYDLENRLERLNKEILDKDHDPKQ